MSKSSLSYPSWFDFWGEPITWFREGMTSFCHFCRSAILSFLGLKIGLIFISFSSHFHPIFDLIFIPFSISFSISFSILFLGQFLAFWSPFLGPVFRSHFSYFQVSFVISRDKPKYQSCILYLAIFGVFLGLSRKVFNVNRGWFISNFWHFRLIFGVRFLGPFLDPF